MIMFCSPHMANLSHTQVIYNRIRFVLLVDNDGYNRGGTYQTIESPIKQIFAKAHKYIGKYCTMHTSLAPTTSVTTTTFLERAIGGLFSLQNGKRSVYNTLLLACFCLTSGG